MEVEMVGDSTNGFRDFVHIELKEDKTDKKKRHLQILSRRKNKNILYSSTSTNTIITNNMFLYNMLISLNMPSNARRVQIVINKLFNNVKIKNNICNKSLALPLHKRNSNKQSVPAKQVDRHIITVPVTHKHISTKTNPTNLINFPDQETIDKCEVLELNNRLSDQLSSDMKVFFSAFNEESDTFKDDKIMHLKNIWKEKIVKYEGMKNELNDRQQAIIEIYASLRDTRQKLTSLGEIADLPSTDELHIMNVANMTPDQLLKLCTEAKNLNENQGNKNTLSIDMKKLNEMPSKLVGTCEQALSTRREFIEWFENLKNQEKGCSKSVLSKKINEFNAENDMLDSCLKNVKNEFLKEINDFIRICCNETVSLQLRNEDLICQISELNSQNSDLRKKIGNFENQKSYANKLKIEELEQELKEEKMKRMSIKDRLTRTECQLKNGEERIRLHEAALDQARTQTRLLERTKQQLNDQNKELRKGFDEELTILKESMQKNTVQLEEISHAKEKLQQEKEDLKNKLEELSNHYNDSMMNMKQELNKNIAKLIDVETKYNDEIEYKKQLEETIQSQCAHLVESELRLKDILKQLQEKESALSELINYKNKYEEAIKKIEEKVLEIDNYRDRDFKRNEVVHELEQKLQNMMKLKEELNTVVNNKEEHIEELENKLILLNQQIQESEQKMESYEDQLLTLKNHITKLKEYFGDFENLNDLHEMVNQQKNELRNTKLHNDEVLKQIEDKKYILESLSKAILEQEEKFNQNQENLKILSDKRQQNQTTLLLNQKIFEKDSEIETLITNVKNMKRQINQLQTIIFSLENQNRIATTQNRKGQEKIYKLQNIIREYEIYIEQKTKNLPSEDLDNLINTLEDELGIQLESRNIITTNYINSAQNESILKNTLAQQKSFSQLETQITPTKIVMGNYIKKTYVANNEDNLESVGCKKAITNIQAQNEITNEAENIFFADSKLRSNNDFSLNCNDRFRNINEKTRNLHYMESNLGGGEKKSKILKLASHRLL